MKAKARPGRTGRSFTESARRAQIVSAAIDTVAELGYAKTSFSQIAKRAGLSSTGLISYHFAGKDDLLAEVASTVLAEFAAYVGPRVDAADSPKEELRVFVEANIDFVQSHRGHLQALMDIAVNTRDNRHLATIGQADLAALEDVLRRGQQAGEFGGFDPAVMAVAVMSLRNGLITRITAEPGLDLAPYRREFVALLDRATRKESR